MNAETVMPPTPVPASLTEGAQGYAAELAAFTRRWRLGLFVAGGLMALALGGLVCLAFGVYDFTAPLADSWRPRVTLALYSLLALVAIRSLVPGLSFTRRDAAAVADAAHPGRRPVTTALELRKDGGSALHAFLVDRAQRAGAEALAATQPSERLPLSRMRRCAGWLLGVMAGLIVLWVVNSSAVRTISARLFFPHEDIPPYSDLVFEVTPEHPKAVYGSDAEVVARISGGVLPDGVVVLSRADAESPVSRTGAFAMGDGRYSLRLQRVVEPVQVAFASGAARSRWVTVDVMRQPRVEGVMLTVTPPSYSNLPVREFALGSTDLAALAGSTVEARVRSNRPLSGGQVTITPPRSVSRENPETLEVRSDGAREVVLRWQVKTGGLVRIDLRDISGASSAAPVEIQQKLIPDEVPEIGLQSPGKVTLATPDSKVPVILEAEDDLGVARVDLVRKLAGYRDRGRILTADAGDRSFAQQDTLELANLGVVPGQVLEFYAEAHDHNPNLMGIGTSGVGRIQVISAQEFRDIHRARTTLAQFRARFSALDQAVEGVRAALTQVASSGDPASRAAAERAMQRAQSLANAMAGDLVVFDAEQQVADAAREVADLMQKLQKDLAAAADTESLKKAAAAELEELGPAISRTQKLKADGQTYAMLGRVMEMAAEFRAMHEVQRKLTRELESLARRIMIGDLRDAAQLEGMARQQRMQLERWKTWLPELRRAAEALPAEFDELAKDSLAFADAAENAGIQRAMETALQQAAKDSTPNTFVNAQLALVGMDQLVNQAPQGVEQEGNQFGQMCAGQQPSLGEGLTQDLSSGGMAETLAQMLQGMCKRRGQNPGAGTSSGSGSGGGGGGGEGGENGFSQDADPLLSAPVFGPDRLAFEEDGPSRQTRGRGDGRGQRPKIGADAAAHIDSPTTRTEARRQISLRDVPERYRDAVRRFYGEDAVRETTIPPTKPQPKP